MPLYLLAFAVFLVADPRASLTAPGALLVLSGVVLRVWGAGFLTKNERLCVAGPYAYLRHPLYAGALLVALGLGAMAGLRALLLVIGIALPAFCVYYLPYKDRIEGARLERRFGAAASAWRSAVPALLPRRKPWVPPPAVQHDAPRWSGGCFRENGELGTVLGVAAAMALLGLRAAGLG